MGESALVVPGFYRDGAAVRCVACHSPAFGWLDQALGRPDHYYVRCAACGTAAHSWADRTTDSLLRTIIALAEQQEAPADGG